MRVLILGKGGREHALAWKINKSSRVEKIYISPGNYGTSLIGENITLNKPIEIVCKNKRIDLVIIGSDEYLERGFADRLIENGIKVFGPTRAASEIEWSKSYAKKFMKDHGIPTADFVEFSNIDLAIKYINEHDKFPVVIKADGLAAGKGVFIAYSKEKAVEFIYELMKEKIFGSSGERIVIEEFLEGEEISVHAFCDGENASIFPISKDHKRLSSNLESPNTGGMGVIAPIEFDILDEIKTKIIKPTLLGLKKAGREFIGVLYPGLIITKTGLKVVEFNARFGDPETQAYMRILDTDLIEIIEKCICGKILDINIKWSNLYSCCIIMASKEYPNPCKTSIEINPPIDNDSFVFFHSGTKKENGKILTNGGRVIGVTNIGDNKYECINKTYKKIKSIGLESLIYRNDIKF